MYETITKCRISGSPNLVPVLSLGDQCLTGVFPKIPTTEVPKCPLDLVWCPDSGLVQLRHSCSPAELYGDRYGYRSGLNSSMVTHLQRKAGYMEQHFDLSPGDVVIDIGSNDATLLQGYNRREHRIGVDPLGDKFRNYYTDGLILIPDFFSSRCLNRFRKAKLITSIAMFYDLEHPLDFVRDIGLCLTDDGIWHFEQSYLPSMLRTGAYDVICHEHLEYYTFTVVEKMLCDCGLRIIDVQFNDINGGSFAITACKHGAHHDSNLPVIEWVLEQEQCRSSMKPYLDFAKGIQKHKDDLVRLIGSLVRSGKKVFGYGASTKGNVLLQYCGFTPEQIPFIADVNEQKSGCYTPGTHIPIISEVEARSMQPDYFLVLPWHFKESILEREQIFIRNGGRFIFPFPEISIF